MLPRSAPRSKLLVVVSSLDPTTDSGRAPSLGLIGAPPHHGQVRMSGFRILLGRSPLLAEERVLHLVQPSEGLVP